MSLKDYHDLLIELRNENISYKEIAERLGYKRDSIKHYCQKNNIRGIEIDNSIETREQNYIKRFVEKFPNFEYVSGYEKYDSTIKVRCKVCGHVQERNAHNKDYTQCNKCVELERIKNLKAKEHEAELIEKQRLISDLIKALSRQINAKEREEQLHKTCQRCESNYIATTLKSVHCDKCLEEIKKEQIIKIESLQGRTCKECGKAFNANNLNNNYCSDSCKRKYNNRMKEISRYKYKKNGKVDYDISLKKLYKRDKGICHICSRKCDYNDYNDDNNIFIVGKDYPSIDHVFPKSKGGTHTWDNVKLAHMKCNTEKRDKIIYEELNGQFRIF